MKNLSRIGILINALVILACVIALISLVNVGSFSQQFEENERIIKKINGETDLEKLRKFSLGAQELRKSSLELMDKQMVFMKWFLLSAVGISCINALMFFLSVRRRKKKQRLTRKMHLTKRPSGDLPHRYATRKYSVRI